MTLASQTSPMFPTGFFLASLSSLELTVSPSNQACQPWILATLLPASVTSSASTPGQPDTAGESQSLGLHFSFLSCSSQSKPCLTSSS